MCVFRVLQVLESGLADYGVTLGRLEKHYRVCLSADANGRKDAAAATLLHSQVRLTAVQGLLACGVKNAQSASAARELLDRVYRTSGHRQATDGILKGFSAGEATHRARGDRRTGPGAARGPLGSAEGAAPPWGAEASAAVPCEPGRRRSRGHEYRRPQREIQENGHNGRDDGVYPHRRPRGGAAGDGRVEDDQEEGVGVAAGMLRYVRYVCSSFLPPNAPLELLPVVLRVRRVIHVAEVVLLDVPPGVIILVPCVFIADGSRLRGRSEHNPVASATPVWVPPSPAPGPA